MAESKSEHFSFLINRLSEKTAKFSPNSINRLGRVSECRRECAEPALTHYDSRVFSRHSDRSKFQSFNRAGCPSVLMRRAPLCHKVKSDKGVSLNNAQS